jgi:hypothetical protein
VIDMVKEQENKKILKGEDQGNIESPPDPKTVSNATRVDEWVDADGVRHTAADRNKQKKNTNAKGGNIDEDVDKLPNSSDQPEEIEDKEEEQEAQKVDTDKKQQTDSGKKDTSHATIGKDEEKESKDQNKKNDSKKSNQESKSNDSQNRKSNDTQTSTQKASNDKIETQTTTTTKKKE